MAANPKCWMKCEDCEHREILRRSAIERRTRPRCAMCGGLLRMSEASYNDVIAGMDARRQKEEKKRVDGNR